MTTPTPEEVAEKLARKSIEAILDSMRKEGFDPRWDSADEFGFAKSLTALLLEYEQLRRAAMDMTRADAGYTWTAIQARLSKAVTNLNTALREKGIEP